MDICHSYPYRTCPACIVHVAFDSWLHSPARARVVVLEFSDAQAEFLGYSSAQQRTQDTCIDSVFQLRPNQEFQRYIFGVPLSLLLQKFSVDDSDPSVTLTRVLDSIDIDMSDKILPRAKMPPSELRRHHLKLRCDFARVSVLVSMRPAAPTACSMISAYSRYVHYALS